MTLQANGAQRGPNAASLDRAGERSLREEIRAEIARLLGERQLLEPRAEDEARIRTLIHDRVAAYQRPAAAFLDAAVQAGVNILVSGPTGAGKTTLLNALGASIASVDERIVTVEEVAELQLERQLPDCVALQARASNIEGTGEVSIRDLV